MAEFLPAIEYVLENEGGYSDCRTDPGGRTNFGILQRDWPQVDISSITREQAIAWYLQNWWPRAPYAQMNSQQVCTKLFDVGVNMGIITSGLMCQRALALPLSQLDGRIGPITTAALNATAPGVFLPRLVELLEEHYSYIESYNPKTIVFDRGWRSRAQRLPPPDAPLGVAATV